MATVDRSPCLHWHGDRGAYCHAETGVRPYLVGPRCPQHTPAALAGHPEPPSVPLGVAPATVTDPGVVMPTLVVPQPNRPTADHEQEQEGLPSAASPVGSGLRPRRTLLDHALSYAARGWPVFLLGRSKRPVANCHGCRSAGSDHDPAGCGCLTCHGFYAATTDPQRITAMLDAVPGGLLAIRTGTASGLAVVDIDPRNGGRLDAALMVPTFTVATGADGWHLYYQHPGVCLPPALPAHPGVDIKADGGYVVAPPSRHPATGRRYRHVGRRGVNEMAPALIAACQATPAPAAPPVIRPATHPGAGAISSPEALLAANVRAVANAPKGAHRRALYGASRGVARMILAEAITRTEGEIALTNAGRDAHQSDREIREAIKGGFRAEGLAA